MNARWKAPLACLMLLFASAAAQASVQDTLQETVKYIHTDALGSIVAITDANGQVIERREYEPYGAQLLPELQDGPGYTGHVQDATTGLVYMQQRYYDPQIGRFLSLDPVEEDRDSGDNFNRYWYARNSPYRFTDPDGRQACRVGTICSNNPFEGDPFKRYSFSGGGVAALRTSARSGLDTGDLTRAMSVDPAPNVKLRDGVQLKDDFVRNDLQALSNSLGGKDIDVISGYRSQERQDGLIRDNNPRAARSSQHTNGRAADIKVVGISQRDLGVAAYRFGRFERVNVYSSSAAGVHVDYMDVGEGTQLYRDWARARP